MDLSAGVEGRTVRPGAASGPLLVLSAPLSFWGGVDPATGTIIATRHPQHGRSIAGTILALPAAIGSSSSSAVMLELIHAGHAPAALVLGTVDAILIVGCLAAQEMGWPAPPVMQLDAGAFGSLTWERADIAADVNGAAIIRPA